jgi:hypothetical protein
VRGDMMMMTCQRAGGKKTIRERNQSAPALRFFEGVFAFLGGRGAMLHVLRFVAWLAIWVVMWELSVVRIGQLRVCVCVCLFAVVLDGSGGEATLNGLGSAANTVAVVR